MDFFKALSLFLLVWPWIIVHISILSLFAWSLGAEPKILGAFVALVLIPVLATLAGVGYVNKKLLWVAFKGVWIRRAKDVTVKEVSPAPPPRRRRRVID